VINIEGIFNSKGLLSRYRENFFYDSGDISFNTGLIKPVLFIADKEAAINAPYYGMHQIEDIDYDIYVISCNTTVLLYLINIKVPLYKLLPNGIIIRRRPPKETDKIGVKVKYSLEHFQVISNQLATCSIFATDITADPTT
jgi:hypothetical protein